MRMIVFLELSRYAARTVSGSNVVSVVWNQVLIFRLRLHPHFDRQNLC